MLEVLGLSLNSEMFPTNVFNCFSGHVKAAGLTSPEAQVMNGPTLTSFINGHFALTDIGLSECYGG